MATGKIWIWAVTLWIVAQAASTAVKLWVLPGTAIGIVLIPTWCMAAFSVLYGLWCLITTAAVDFELTFDGEDLEETQCECKN